MASQHLQPKQRLFPWLSPIFDVLEDLIISLLGYTILVIVLDVSARLTSQIINLIRCGPNADFIVMPWDNEILLGLILVLWITRLLFRWRRHSTCVLGCLWDYLTTFLRWLSPFSTEPYMACACCQMATEGKPTTHNKQQDPSYTEYRNVGLFLWSAKRDGREHFLTYLAIYGYGILWVVRGRNTAGSYAPGKSEIMFNITFQPSTANGTDI